MFFSTLTLLITACSEKEVQEEEGKDWNSADLKELSSGECPDMSQSGELVSFLSSGEERNVTFVLPSNPQPKMKLIFFYHGLVGAGSNPTTYTAEALDFQGFADAHNAMFILPESKIWELMAQQFHMWNVEEGTSDQDLALFDDLRTCAAQNFDVNLDMLTSGGFSGGALFNTVLLSERSDTLAGVVEMSGGADIEVASFEEDFAPYSTPEHDLPILLISGGENDLWPDPAFTIVHFENATTTLHERLIADENFVIRCRHNTGHNITNKAFYAAMDWLTNHEYGVPSPYQASIGDLADWCE